MILILILVGIFLFSYLAHQFEQEETYKSIQREINNEVKKGVSVKLTDGRIVYTEDISSEDKRLTPKYVYLLKRGNSHAQLDNFNFKRLKKEYDIEIAKEMAEIEEKRRLERIIAEKERILLAEKEREAREIREKIEKQKIWINAKKFCVLFDASSINCQSGVYLIHSVSTNDFYIGSSINLYNRRSQHLYSLKNSTHYSYKMQEHFDLYGIENFKFYILERVVNAEGNMQKNVESREQYYIDLLNPSYNYWKNVKEGKLNHLGRNNSFNL